MTDPDLVDRLAAFCRFHERGWKSSITGKWYRATEPAREWRPDESDDDCRVVLERFYEVATKKQKILFYEIDPRICIRCERCMDNCPNSAISPVVEGMPGFDGA